MPFYERQPYIEPLYQMVSEVMNGDIRVPRFQRPGSAATWSPEQRGDLLDSLYRGYPIGTVLLWSTNKSINTLNEVGGKRIPDRSDTDIAPLRLLLDGHQRLSSLVQILGSGLVGDSETNVSDETWVFELDVPKAAASRDRFQLLRPGAIPSDTQVPLGIVLNRAKLNQWIRDSSTITEQQIKEVDDLRDRLREYSIPVAVLVADSLDEATVSFKRINSSGTPMSDYNMVTALAYQDDFDPQILFEQEKLEFLEPLGWGTVDDSDILRVCAGLVGQNPARLEVDELANCLRENRGVIRAAFSALQRTIADVFIPAGIRSPEILPYSWQLITVAIFVGQRPDVELLSKSENIMQWVWLTTYGEVFAGGTKTSVYSRTSRALNDMIDGKGWSAMERDVNRTVRPVDRFDFRAARSRACALSMARLQDQGNVAGEAHQALAQGVSSMHLLSLRGTQRTIWWHLGILPETGKISEVREALKRRESGTLDLYGEKILNAVGIGENDVGTAKQVLEARRDRLLAAEAKFVQVIGLSWEG
jgi:hypothetical protein